MQILSAFCLHEKEGFVSIKIINIVFLNLYMYVSSLIYCMVLPSLHALKDWTTWYGYVPYRDASRNYTTSSRFVGS